MKTYYWLKQNRLLSHLRFATSLSLILSAFVIELLDPPPYSVTGTWNLNIDPQTPAQVTLNVFYNSSHHLAFGYNALMQVSFVNGVYVFTGFGDAATATLDTNATPARFSWHVELGVSCPNQYPYNSLTFLGEANRGGG
jgi:hypothetical protein